MIKTTIKRIEIAYKRFHQLLEIRQKRELEENVHTNCTKK